MSSITITPNLQSKSVSSSTSAQTIIPDSGYCRLKQVNISAFSGEIVDTYYYDFSRSDFTYMYNQYDQVYPYYYQLTNSLSVNWGIQEKNKKFVITAINIQANNPSTGASLLTNGTSFCCQMSTSSFYNSSFAHNCSLWYNSSSSSQMFQFRGIATISTTDNINYSLMVNFNFDQTGYNYFKLFSSFDAQLYINVI